MYLVAAVHEEDSQDDSSSGLSAACASNLNHTGFIEQRDQPSHFGYHSFVLNGDNMAHQEESNLQQTASNAGLVDNVRRQWAVHEDAVIANRLQDSEFASKYKRNIDERQLARCDVPMAKLIQSKEELQLQQQQMVQIEKMKQITDNDAVVAQQLHKDELACTEYDRALRKDMELARELQHKERIRYELRKQEKELRRQRKRLELELQQQAAAAAAAAATCVGEQNSDLLTDSVCRVDNHVNRPNEVSNTANTPVQSKSSRDTSGRGQADEQQMRDEALARYLQEQEQKHSKAASDNHQKQIELRDAELAQLLQEEENLREQRRKTGHHKHRHSHHHHHPSDVIAAAAAAAGNDGVVGGGQRTAEEYAFEQFQQQQQRQQQQTRAGRRHSDLHAMNNAFDDRRSSTSQPALSDSIRQPSGDDLLPNYSCNVDQQQSHHKLATRPLPATPQTTSPFTSADLPLNVSTVHARDQVGQRSEGQRSANGYARRIDSLDEQLVLQNEPVRERGRKSRAERLEDPMENLSQPKQDSLPSPSTEPLNFNVFAAIDPTFNRDSTAAACSSAGTMSGLPDINATQLRGPVEDGYYDADKLHAGISDMNIVRGHRRSSSGRDGRDSNRGSSSSTSSNCKQQ